MPSKRTALMLSLWLLCATNAVQAAPAGSACPAPHRQPPVYPHGLMKDGVGGKTVLILSPDRCGLVTGVEIEESSGYDELDAAAVLAARSWTLGPQPVDRKTRQPGRVRVPVTFRIDETPEGITDYGLPSDRPRDAHFTGRREMRSQGTPALPDGRLPGYVADAFPIGVATVADAVAMLEKYGRRQPTLVEGVAEYFLGDAEGFSRWIVLSGGFRFAPSVYRMRLVGDGPSGFFVTSALCGAAKREDCAGLDRYLRSQPAQVAMPAPPMLPKLIPPSAPPGAVQGSAPSARTASDGALSMFDTTITANAEGTAVLRVSFDARGNAVDIQVERTSGSPELDRMALKAARRWRAKPERANVKAAGHTISVPVQFKKP